MTASPAPGETGASPPAMRPGRDNDVRLYAAIGAEMVAYAVDPAALTLTRQGSATLPEAVQYAWRHPHRPLLYVAFSNRPTSKADDRHGVAAYRIGRHSGAPEPFGAPVSLRSRPIHITVSPDGEYLLAAYNQPSGLSVHRLGPDGAISEEVRQTEALDPGIYAHQVRVAPSGRFVVLVARGNDATAAKPADPGALKLFRFRDGQLSPAGSLTRGDGREFGPRHVDFHPAKPWMYVSMERSNQMLTYAVEADGIAPEPLFANATLRQGTGAKLPVQFAGAIRVHPNGRSVYVTNRSDGTVDFRGRKVHGPGENSVAVFAIDQQTGRPSLVQTIDTQSFHCRTLAIHPDGRMLVTAAVAPLAVRDGDEVRTVPAGLTVFGAGADGTLRLARKYDVEVGDAMLFWCGMVAP